MLIKPVLTEKTLNDAKKGNFTFWVHKNLNKYQISELIEKAFKVDVTKVATMNYKREEKRNNRGRRVVVQPRKKAIVTLKEGQKIAMFGLDEKK